MILMITGSIFNQWNIISYGEKNSFILWGLVQDWANMSNGILIWSWFTMQPSLKIQISNLSELKQFEASWKGHSFQCDLPNQTYIIRHPTAKGSRLKTVEVVSGAAITHFIKKSFQLSVVVFHDINLCRCSGKELDLHLQALCIVDENNLISPVDYRVRTCWTVEQWQFIASNF